MSESAMVCEVSESAMVCEVSQCGGYGGYSASA